MSKNPKNKKPVPSRAGRDKALIRRPETPTYAETVGEQSRAMIADAAKKIIEIFTRMQRRAKTIQAEILGTAQDALQLGFYFQQASGRDQLEFFLFEKIPGLPEELTFKLAQNCVAMVRRHGVNHKFTIAEAMPEIQSLFQCMNVLEAPRRDGATGGGQPRNWGTWIVKAFTPINNELDELLGAEPAEQWSADRREMFLAQTKRVHDEHERVKALAAE